MAYIGMQLRRDTSKFERAMIGWYPYTRISKPNAREAVTAKAMFGLEEVSKASSAYFSTTTFERYIAFSSLACRYQSKSECHSSTTLCSCHNVIPLKF